MILESSFYLLGLVPAVLALLLAIKLSKVGRRSADLPPGPPTIPLLGNLHLMPTKRPHLQFQKWAQEYGPIYSLVLGTRNFIVLSDDVGIKEVLDKRGNIYSDRPEMFIGQNIASGGLRLVLMRYGETWRMIHRMMHNILNIKTAVTYVPYQDLENKVFLSALLDTPDDLLAHIRRGSYSLSTQMIFGYRCIDNKDPNLLHLFSTFERWSALSASASAQLADLYPILQKLPEFIAPNVRYARKLHEEEKQLYVKQWMTAKNALDAGTGLPCFCNDIYRAQSVQGFSDAAAAYISGSLLDAGSDTTASEMYGFVQAMLVWPEVQRKAQEELDRVVGPDRLPELEDYESLPYIRCCIKETLRWMPSVSLGVPHSVIKDDTYMGYSIPKGSTIIPNIWAIHMDQQRSPDPRVFNPDRYKDDHTSLYQSAIGDTTKRDNFVFGAGRRMCQGIHIAENSMFLGISRLLWGFDFAPAKDDMGNPIIYDIENLVGGITIQPEDYKCIITPRSQKAANIIRKEAENVQELLDPVTKQWKKVPEGMAFSTWVPEKADA
ncbi:cytochrome p450 monooxygenase [Thelonectria olida]|uniref:Cytochrome p450 monooxygenase n=1 Tax=Thelonectria olida TaxID=1576542 RepID=A0A9P8W312_9HYPO|nr:cytochrome p450 monooxygenase [Thelonectria olida]